MDQMPIDFEPSAPANASRVEDWELWDDHGMYRYYAEAEAYPDVFICGYQYMDGAGRGERMVYLRASREPGSGGDREMTADETRALSLALWDAANRV